MTALAGIALAATVLLGRPRSRSRARLSSPREASAVGCAVLGAGLAAVAMLAGVSAGTVVAAVGVGAAGVTHVRRRQRRRVQAGRARDAVVLTRSLAAELRAGRPPGAAFAAVAPAVPALAPQVLEMARAADLGADVAGELRRMAALDGAARLGAVAAAWAAMTATGARVAAVLDDVAAGFEADDELRDELDAMLGGPRATVVVLALLPGAALLLATALGAHPVPMLVHTRVGQVLLVSAMLLEAAGLGWMRVVTVRAVAAR